MQSDVPRSRRMPAAVLRPGLPDAGAGRHREMQVPIRLVLSREVRDVPAHAGGARVQLGGRCIPGSDLSIGTRSPRSLRSD